MHYSPGGANSGDEAREGTSPSVSLACSCWRCHSRLPIAYTGSGGGGFWPRMASARWRVYSNMPQCGIGSTRSSVNPHQSSPPRTHIARGEDQRRLAAVQIGELALEQEMHMAVAGDVAGAAGAGPDRSQCLLHRRQHGLVLAHAEIIVRAPHRDLGADAVVIGAWKPPAAPLEIGKDAIPPLGAQSVEPLPAFVIHPRIARC